MSRPRARVALALGAIVATLGMSACGGATAASGPPAEVRLGYFPNLTHATAGVLLPRLLQHRRRQART